MNSYQELFEQQLAEWGTRPVRTPAELASQRIVRRLAGRQRPVAWWQAAAAAALLAGVMLTVWLVSPTPAVPLRERLREGYLPVGGNKIAWIVDADTVSVFTLDLQDGQKGQQT